MTFTLAFIIGIIGWTLCEYVLHRYVGHSKKAIGGFTREHLSHHSAGDYFMPHLKKIRVSLQMLIPLAIISIFIFGGEQGSGFALGFALFFMVYEVLHKRAHTHAPRTSYGRWLRRHHFYHHFSAPRKNFGVTTPLWDVVFRSYSSVGMIRLPAKKAMCWLVDPQTQEVLPQFSADYQIRSAKRYRGKSA
jgi:sterol desaturase/sphingolipid hydroxylase (fatty acid hydroxylase superfamily)